MVAHLRVAGTEVTVEPENYPSGRIARTRDPDGNLIELRQPQEDADSPRSIDG
jgi:predicted enzyme related to lactoylglutathione lyase